MGYNTMRNCRGIVEMDIANVFIGGFVMESFVHFVEGFETFWMVFYWILGFVSAFVLAAIIYTLIVRVSDAAVKKIKSIWKYLVN